MAVGSVLRVFSPRLSSSSSLSPAGVSGLLPKSQNSIVNLGSFSHSAFLRRTISTATALRGRSLLYGRIGTAGKKNAPLPFGGQRVDHQGLQCRAALPDFVDLAPATAAVYGASLLGGGVFAFSRTGSTGSLGGGLTAGVALGLSFYLLQNPDTQSVGNALGFGAALIFASVFGIRLAATKKLVPSGILLGISILAVVIFANAYFGSKS